jgi:putative ABC transport system permease protein
MKVIQIAARNVARQKRRALLLGGAVALGAGVMLLVDSLTNGMAASLRANVTAANAGVLYISGSEWQENGTALKRLEDDSIIKAALVDAGLRVRQFVRKTGAEGTLVFGSKSTRLAIVGIPWEGASSALGSLELSSGSLDGMKQEAGMVIPRSVADRLGVKAGESILVKAATVTGQLNVLDFTVAAVISDSGASMFSAGYARIERVNELVNLKRDESQQLNLYLDEGAALPVGPRAATGSGMTGTYLDRAAAALIPALRARGALVRDRAVASTDPMSAIRGGDGAGDGPPGMTFAFGNKRLEPWKGTKYSVATLDDVASELMTPITTIKGIGYAVFAALLAICMVGVINTFRMVLLERTREIGTMRAMGVRAREVERLFLAEAVMMTGGGALAGMAASFVIMPIVSLFRMANSGMLSMFLTEGHLIFRPSLSGTLICVFLVILSGSLAALFPARQAAALQPAVALRSIG